MLTKPEFRVVEGGAMDKMKALEHALAQIEKMHGKGSVMRLGAHEHTMDVEAISTGSLSLDIALGIGGLPRGRVIEIYGPESSGKTTLALQVVAEAQKNGGICGFIDAEHALDPVYARKLGVKVDDLLVSQPDTGEQALEIADTLVRSGAIDVIVVNSVAALDAQGRARGRDGRHAARHAGAPHEQGLAQAHRRRSPSRNTMVIFINQIRMKIGIMFGNPETTTGGNALEILRFRAPRHPPHRPDQGARRGRRQPDARQGRQEQGGPAVQAGRVRHHVRRGHLQDGRASSISA